MKIGDLIVRAYAWREFVPGIIVDEWEETIDCTADEPEFQFPSFENTYFRVQWSDGTQSTEQSTEVEPLAPALEDHIRYSKEYASSDSFQHRGLHEIDAAK